LIEHINNIDISIRQATKHDEFALSEFYRTAYGNEKFKYPERWTWLYKDNPFIGDNALPIWIAKHNNKIVGHTGAMYVPFKLFNEERVGAWSVDTILLPFCRGRGIGKRLQKANQDANDFFASLSMSDVNRSIKIKLGGVEGASACRFLNTRRLCPDLLIPKESLNKKIGSVLGVSMLNLIKWFRCEKIIGFYYLRKIYRATKRSTSSVDSLGVEFKLVNGRFGDEVDKLWKIVRSQYDITVEKNSLYLNWKYIDQPFTEYQRYFAYKNNKLTGVVIFRIGSPPEPKIGVIVEIISRDNTEKGISSLMKLAMKAIYKQKAIAIYFSGSSVDQEAGALKLGFLPVSREALVLHDQLNNDSLFSKKNKTNLGYGDHDWDQYPRIRQLSITEIRQMLKKQKKTKNMLLHADK
jgi:hypothetical protein